MTVPVGVAGAPGAAGLAGVAGVPEEDGAVETKGEVFAGVCRDAAGDVAVGDAGVAVGAVGELSLGV